MPRLRAAAMEQVLARRPAESGRSRLSNRDSQATAIPAIVHGARPSRPLRAACRRLPSPTWRLFGHDGARRAAWIDEAASPYAVPRRPRLRAPGPSDGEPRPRQPGPAEAVRRSGWRPARREDRTSLRTPWRSPSTEAEEVEVEMRRSRRRPSAGQVPDPSSSPEGAERGRTTRTGADSQGCPTRRRGCRSESTHPARAVSWRAPVALETGVGLRGPRLASAASGPGRDRSRAPPGRRGLQGARGRPDACRRALRAESTEPAQDLTTRMRSRL